jgi:stearoyl-CoA desaturase (delta-9 desaturase)
LAHPKKVPPVVVLKDERPVGMATLHAVIAHRYDLMANYAGELRATLQAEIAHLRAEAAQQARHAGERATALRADLAARIQALSATRRWIKYDADMLQPAARQQLESAARASEKLSRMLAMREELRQIWERSNASAEQLVEQLRDWCKRAEESGIASLQALSLRMRSYA